ncbi:MAG: hypothetical protein QXT25_03910 [Candidatus Anstonellaceae archaeon]
MKLLHVLILLFFFGILAADVIIPDAHRVATFVRFVNLNEYPQASFYLVHKPADSGPFTREPIYGSEWISLDRGYKFDSYYLVMNVPGKPELNASLENYVYLPNSDPRRTVWISYRVIYNQTSHTFLLEKVDEVFPGSSDNLSAVAIVLLLITSAVAIWKIKRGKV